MLHKYTPTLFKRFTEPMLIAGQQTIGGLSRNDEAQNAQQILFEALFEALIIITTVTCGWWRFLLKSQYSLAINNSIVNNSPLASLAEYKMPSCVFQRGIDNVGREPSCRGPYPKHP